MNYIEVQKMRKEASFLGPLTKLLKIKAIKSKPLVSQALRGGAKDIAPLDLHKEWLFKGMYDPKFLKGLNYKTPQALADLQMDNRAFSYIDAIRKSLNDKTSLIYSKVPELEAFLRDKGVFKAQHAGMNAERLYQNMRALSEKADELRKFPANRGAADSIAAAFKWLKTNGGI